MKNKIPHPELLRLLEIYGMTCKQFWRQGRPPKGDEWVLERRKDLITDLHLKGTPWKTMIEITGMSQGAIQRGTRGMWNEASAKNLSDNGKKIGSSRKGEVKPWLSEQLKKDWQAGKYDFHKGRICSPEEKHKMKMSWTPEHRERTSKFFKKLWETPSYRDKLLAIHRSPEQRRKYSINAGIQRQNSLTVYSIQSWYEPVKCSNYPLYTRSSYERAACMLLDEDPLVHDYDYEPPITLKNGHQIYPDFVVRYNDGTTTLVEVKASWVLSMPSTDKLRIRLSIAEEEAGKRNWNFAVWTEKDTLADAIKKRKNTECLLVRKSKNAVCKP